MSANFTGNRDLRFDCAGVSPEIVKKINVFPNFLIHIAPVNWLHCEHIDGAEYYWRIAKLI